MVTIQQAINPNLVKDINIKKIIKPIWEELYGPRTVGRGLKTVIIPSDPEELTNRLDLLLASKTAGNTGVRNEAISICDELLQQKEMSKLDYKKIMSTILK